jgi:CIC family chloride channel protein
LSDILVRIATAEGAYYPVIDDEGSMTGIFSVNDIRRILNEEIPPGLVLARDIAVPRVITCRMDETLNQVLGKLSSRGLEELPVVDGAKPGRVLFMLSRRSLLARYAKELEKRRGVYVEV